MSTRGAFGFRIDGIDKITYNHCDSYPDALGQEVVDWVRKACAPNRIEQTLTEVSGIVVVPDSETIATPEHIERTGRRYVNMGVGGGDGIRDTDVTYYRLLRDAQPSHGIANVVDAGIMVDGAKFMGDSLFCEFAYVVNLDDMTVEFYRGFQSNPHDKGRYAAKPTDARSNYYGVALVGSYPIADIADWRKRWERECYASEDDEDEDAA